MSEVKVNVQEFVWTEKYRPQTLDDVIIPDEFKQILRGFIDQGRIPNLLLSGGPGIGKCVGYDTEIIVKIDQDFLDRLNSIGVEYQLVDVQE